MTTESKLDEKILGKKKFNFKNCGMICATKNHLAAFGMLWKRINRPMENVKSRCVFGWALLDEVSCCFMATFLQHLPDVHEWIRNAPRKVGKIASDLPVAKTARAFFVSLLTSIQTGTFVANAQTKRCQVSRKMGGNDEKRIMLYGHVFLCFLLRGLQLDGVTWMTCFWVLLPDDLKVKVPF